MKTGVTIIGGGIVGTAIARELSRYDVNILLVEKEADIAFGGSTKANTGVIHAGYHDVPGTLMARLCPRGNTLWSKLVSELDVPFKRVGAFVVALKERDMDVLRELKRRGRRNKVPDLEIIEESNELFKMEPNLSREAIAVLYAPTAGITCPYEAAIALAENATRNGVRILLGTEVTGITVEKAEVKGVQTNKGSIKTDYVINAAGLWADEISAMAGINHFTITPRKGEYLIFDKNLSGFVNHVLFPVPTITSKGVAVTPTVDGNLLVGPNAHGIRGKTDLTTTPAGLEEVLRSALNLVPKLSLKKGMIIANYAGLRAESSTGDFIIESYGEVRGFINVAGIKSPGLTSAPAIAEMVVDLLKKAGLELKEKDAFDPYRKSIDRSMRGLLVDKAERLIARDPSYGHIVCRCEHVTEGEVVEAVRRGATTLDGIKYRTRAGMGRCQGGFCSPRVIKILARELRISVESVTKRGGHSQLLPCRVKALLLRGEPVDRERR